jgi:3-hydroxymyristoyl/3-hydroxydecanoyl-(acyl carrier protein) dehydratase
MTDSAVREIVVPASHPALPGHFPGGAIVPAAWLVTLVDDARRESFGVDAAAGLARARFRLPVLPGEPLRVELERRNDGSVAFICTRAGERVADGVFAGTGRQ